MEIVFVVAIAENGVIGAGNAMPWRMKSDMARFKALTMGHPIIMGRKTYESIGRPLPGRRNIVLSSRPEFAPAGVEVVPSWEAAMERVSAEDEVFVIGGRAVYRKALPDANRLYLTLVAGDVEGDTFFALRGGSDWKLVSEEFRAADQDHAFDLWFKVYERA